MEGFLLHELTDFGQDENINEVIKFLQSLQYHVMGQDNLPPLDFMYITL